MQLLAFKTGHINETITKEEEDTTTNPLDATRVYSTIETSNVNPISAKDLTFSKCDNDLLVKEIGSIKCQSFMIEECKQCQIFLLDITDQIFIDECSNCDIFIAPCVSSIFLRDCINCNIVAICSQFRIRDCNQCNVMLYSATKPCIETSTKIQLCCYQISYFALLSQMEQTQMNIFGNVWHDVHDFSTDEKSDWKLIHDQTQIRPIFKFVFDEIPAQVLPKIDIIEQIYIPITIGCVDRRAKDANTFMLCVFYEQLQFAISVFQEVIHLYVHQNNEYNAQLIQCKSFQTTNDSRFISNILPYINIKNKKQMCTCFQMSINDSNNSNASSSVQKQLTQNMSSFPNIVCCILSNGYSSENVFSY